MWWAIVGGTELPSSEGPVAALVDAQGAVICTATLIEARWMLTAAHCLAPLGLGGASGGAGAEAWWGTDLVGGSPVEVRLLVSGIAHPELDLALVELESEASATPAALVAVPPAPGQALEARGFGATTDLGEGQGVLRSVTLEVLELEPDLVHTWTAGANLCSGDSGAPLSVPGSEPLALLAVAFGVEPTCLGGGAVSVRVDAAVDFVLSYVSATVLNELPEPDIDTDVIKPVDTGRADTGADTGAPERDEEPPDGDEPDDKSETTRASECGCASAPHRPLAWPWLAGSILLAAFFRRGGAPGSRDRDSGVGRPGTGAAIAPQFV